MYHNNQRGNDRGRSESRRSHEDEEDRYSSGKHRTRWGDERGRDRFSDKSRDYTRDDDRERSRRDRDPDRSSSGRSRSSRWDSSSTRVEDGGGGSRESRRWDKIEGRSSYNDSNSKRSRSRSRSTSPFRKRSDIEFTKFSNPPRSDNNEFTGSATPTGQFFTNDPMTIPNQPTDGFQHINRPPPPPRKSNWSESSDDDTHEDKDNYKSQNQQTKQTQGVALSASMKMFNGPPPSNAAASSSNYIYSALHDDSESKPKAAPPAIGVSLKLGSSATLNKPTPLPKVLSVPVPAKSTKVAAIFNGESDDDEPEEMPAECRMRMKNVGRDTKTSEGPNSFGKTKIGFCNLSHLTEKKLEGKPSEDKSSRKKPH